MFSEEAPDQSGEETIAEGRREKAVRSESRNCGVNSDCISEVVIESALSLTRNVHCSERNNCWIQSALLRWRTTLTGSCCSRRTAQWCGCDTWRFIWRQLRSRKQELWLSGRSKPSHSGEKRCTRREREMRTRRKFFHTFLG